MRGWLDEQRGPVVTRDKCKSSRHQLTRYDAACRALAAVRSVDEVRDIRDKAVAMAAYARQAKNRDLEADAVEIRMRATRRLDQLRQAQKETVGLATGGEHGGRGRIDGVRKTPSIVRPTLAMQGIDKNLARQARALGALSEEEFEAAVADAHDRVARAVRNTVREIEIGQERESPRAAQRKATETETKAARKVDKPQPRKKKVTEGKKPKPSQRELEAKQAHIDELEAAREHDNDLAEQLQAAKIKIAGLESEIEELKAENTELRAKLDAAEASLNRRPSQETTTAQLDMVDAKPSTDGSPVGIKVKLDPRIVPDPKWPGMYRVRLPDGSLSDMVNLTQAKHALVDTE